MMSKKWMSRLAAVLALLTLATACTNDEDDGFGPPEPGVDGPWVLFDHYHARKQNHVDYQLDKGVYTYQGAFGYSRFVEHLERNEYNWREIRDMELSPARLEGYDVLFINLLSDDRPDFTEDEVQTIIDFVEAGGGLFVIADHTNVYDHAERINRFLIPMGVEVLYYTAVDFPPEHSVAGLGWIKVDNLVSHPVMAECEQISLQTGGPMKTDSGEGELAFTSDESFGDLWDESSGLGYYGDWTFKEEDDLRGPLAVHIAAEYGEGRIVVAGDQNMFGDPWLNYVDNFQLAMNSMEWLAQQEQTGAPLRSKDIPGLEIALDQEHSAFNAGNLGNQNGYFAYLVNSNRDRATTTKGSIRYTDEEVIKIMDPSVMFTQEEKDDLQSRLDNGTTVVIGFEPNTVKEPAFDLLATLAPNFTITYDGTDYGVDQWQEFSDLVIVDEDGTKTLSSPDMNISDLVGSAWTSAPNNPAPENSEPMEGEPTNPNAVPYWYPVSSSWGDPFVEDESGEYTIARKKKVGEGELIVFISDGIFRTKTMGDYLRPPSEFNLPAHELHYRFLEYLRNFHGTDE